MWGFGTSEARSSSFPAVFWMTKRATRGEITLKGQSLGHLRRRRSTGRIEHGSGTNCWPTAQGLQGGRRQNPPPFGFVVCDRAPLPRRGRQTCCLPGRALLLHSLEGEDSRCAPSTRVKRVRSVQPPVRELRTYRSAARASALSRVVYLHQRVSPEPSNRSAIRHTAKFARRGEQARRKKLSRQAGLSSGPTA